MERKTGGSDLPLFGRPAMHAGAPPRMEETMPQVPAVKTFAFDDGVLNQLHLVRITTRDGDPWFVLADVCRVLDIGNPSMAAGRLDAEDKQTFDLQALSISEGAALASGMNTTATIINESGLWSLVLTSRKPEAKRFKRWVTAEVIPAIRRTGAYALPGAPAAAPALNLRDPRQLRSIAIQLIEVNEELTEKVAVLQPLAEAHQRLEAAEGSLSITEAAKALGVGQKQLHRWLHANGWIYRNAGGDRWLGYSAKEKTGVLEHRPLLYKSREGEDRNTVQVMVTPKGLALLAKVMQPGGLAA